MKSTLINPANPAGPLVVARLPGEGVTLTMPDGRRIHVEVAQVRGDRVRLAIVAPLDVAILRDELVGVER